MLGWRLTRRTTLSALQDILDEPKIQAENFKAARITSAISFNSKILIAQSIQSKAFMADRVKEKINHEEDSW